MFWRAAHCRKVKKRAKPRGTGIRDAVPGLQRPPPRSRRSGSATFKEFERMNEFDVGPSTISRVEVDEEPPGRPCQSHSCHSPLPVQQRLWPLILPEPPRREYPPPTIAAMVPVVRPSRGSPRVPGLSQGLLPRRDRQAVERLAMARPKPHPDPRANRENARTCRKMSAKGSTGPGKSCPSPPPPTT